MNPVLDRLPILILEPHNRCNCRCVMCDIWKVTDARELTVIELQRHVADIELLGVEWVVFTGGEPLMHSDLFRLVEMLPPAIRTTLLSTGLLLERNAQLIVRHIGDVIVSLDGPRAIHDAIRRVPNAFDTLAAGIRAIHRLKPDFPIAARCTVQALNAGHLRETVGAARDLGLDSISFLAADVTSTAFNRPLAWPEPRQAKVAPDLAVLERELELLIAEYPANGFVVESPAKLRRIVEHSRSPKAPRCNAPWVSAVVDASGNVRPCFFHPPLGNTKTDSLRAVLNSSHAVAFRESLDVATNGVCRQCVCSLYRH